MLHRDGKIARLGDRVRLHATTGTIVLSIDTDEYTAEFTREDWATFLERGVMANFENWGLVHYDQLEEYLVFLSRADGSQT